MSKDLQLIYSAAVKLKLVAEYDKKLSFVELRFGKKRYLFAPNVYCFNDPGSLVLMRHKHLVRKLLATHGIPMVNGFTLTKAQFNHSCLNEQLKNINFPLVLKKSKHLFNKIDTFATVDNVHSLTYHLQTHFLNHDTPVHLEEALNDMRRYRVTIFRGRVVGVVQTYKPFVIGDGKSTLKDLILSHYAKNDRRHLDDTHVSNFIETQGLTVNSVPKKFAYVQLSDSFSREQGGFVYSLGRKIHHESASILKSVTEITGVELVDVEIACLDIMASFKHNSWYLLETFCYTDITLHEQPDYGIKNFVAQDLLKSIIRSHPMSYLKNRIKLIINTLKKANGQ